MRHTQSPEQTGVFECACGNQEEFVGYDERGFPGKECVCGQDVCICEVELRQVLRIVDGEPLYEAFTGGGLFSEIGLYTRIECARCGATIWQGEAASDPVQA